MNHGWRFTLVVPWMGLLLVFVMIAGIKSPRASAQTQSTPGQAKAVPPASNFSTFYCQYPFDQYTPFFHVDPAKKVFLYVGTNPKHFRLAVHDPSGAAAMAILDGSTNVPIPLIPATVDVEAAKIEVQNNGTQAADVCYFYLQ